MPLRGTTDDENRPFSREGSVRGTLLDGRVSDFLDVARPSTRLLLEDAAPPRGTIRLYAAAIVPTRAADPAPALSDLSISETGERIVCSFTFNGAPYAFAWTTVGLARLP